MKIIQIIRREWRARARGIDLFGQVTLRLVVSNTISSCQLHWKFEFKCFLLTTELFCVLEIIYLTSYQPLFSEELSFSIDFIWSFKSANETVRMSLFSFEFLDWLLWSIGLPGKLYYLTKCCYFLLDTRKILERKTSMVFVRNTLFQPLILLLSALAEYL